MTFEPKEGMYCVNRLGEKRGPIYRRNNPIYPWVDDEGTYDVDGRFIGPKSQSDYDLIAEWTDPAADADEWGEWTPMPMGRLPFMAEYQIRHEYRARKATPAPVVTTEIGSAFTCSGDRADIIVDYIDGTPDWSTLRVQP